MSSRPGTPPPRPTASGPSGDSAGLQLRDGARGALGRRGRPPSRGRRGGRGDRRLGRSCGSPPLALGIGVLCGRIGRWWLVDEADPERAAACHRLARTVFAALGAELNAADSLAAEAGAHIAVGDLDTAHEGYNTAAAAFRRAGDLSGLPDATVTALREARTAIPFRRNAVFAARRQAAVMQRHQTKLEAAVRELEQDPGVDPAYSHAGAGSPSRRACWRWRSRPAARTSAARHTSRCCTRRWRQPARPRAAPARGARAGPRHTGPRRAREAYLLHLAETAGEAPTDERLREEIAFLTLVHAWPEAGERWRGGGAPRRGLVEGGPRAVAAPRRARRHSRGRRRPARGAGAARARDRPARAPPRADPAAGGPARAARGPGGRAAVRRSRTDRPRRRRAGDERRPSERCRGPERACVRPGAARPRPRPARPDAACRGPRGRARRGAPPGACVAAPGRGRRGPGASCSPPPAHATTRPPSRRSRPACSAPRRRSRTPRSCCATSPRTGSSA